MTQTIATAKQTVTIEFTDAKLIACTARQDMPAYGIKSGERFVLKRVGKHTYEIKKLELVKTEKLASGSVSCTVKNGDNKVYHHLLNRSRIHTCDCAAGKAGQACYHVYYARSVMNSKIRAARRKITDISARGTLNGNQGFSLLKSA